jgi:integrase
VAKRRSLNHQVVDALNAVTRIGESRHAAKEAGTAGRLIHSNGARRTYQQRCVTAVAWMQHHRPEIRELRDITHDDITAYFADCQARGIASTRTIRAALNKLEHGLKARRWWSATTPWMPNIAISTPRSNNGPRYGWSPDKCQQLIEHLGGEARLAADIALNTGLRISEIVRLRASDINREKGEITVQNGKGGRTRIVTWLRDPSVLDRIPQENDSIFAWGGRRQRSVEDAIRTQVAAARDALELPADGRNMHALRSAYAAAFVETVLARGVDEDSARSLLTLQLGHNRTSITYRYVPRLTPATRR